LAHQRRQDGGNGLADGTDLLNPVEVAPDIVPSRLDARDIEAAQRIGTDQIWHQGGVPIGTTEMIGGRRIEGVSTTAVFTKW
jgi:hypothetical protein